MKIEIYFTPIFFNGNMDLIVEADGQRLAHWFDTQEVNSQQRIVFDIEKSTVDSLLLTLKFSEKNQELDTLVDNSGDIIKDKAIIIDCLVVNGIEIYNELYLLSFNTYCGKTITNSSYFGFNGVFDIDISPNLFTWLTICKNQLSNSTTNDNSFADFLDEIL